MNDQTSPELPNSLRCPLCGEPNACVPAGCGDPNADCWCRQAVFSSALLDQIPPAQKGVACICARCAEAGVKGAAASAEGSLPSAP